MILHFRGALPVVLMLSMRRFPVLRRVLGALALALVLPHAAAGQGSAGQGVPTIAVLDFNAFSLTPGEDAASVGRGLAAMIATELSQRPSVRVIDRQQVDELIQKRQLGLT